MTRDDLYAPKYSILTTTIAKNGRMLWWHTRNNGVNAHSKTWHRISATDAAKLSRAGAQYVEGGKK